MIEYLQAWVYRSMGIFRFGYLLPWISSGLGIYWLGFYRLSNQLTGCIVQHYKRTRQLRSPCISSDDVPRCLQMYAYDQGEVAAMLDQGIALSPGLHTSMALEYTRVSNG